MTISTIFSTQFLNNMVNQFKGALHLRKLLCLYSYALNFYYWPEAWNIANNQMYRESMIGLNNNETRN